MKEAFGASEGRARGRRSRSRVAAVCNDKGVPPRDGIDREDRELIRGGCVYADKGDVARHDGGVGP